MSFPGGPGLKEHEGILHNTIKKLKDEIERLERLKK